MADSELYQRGLDLYKKMYGDGPGDLDDLPLPEDDPFRRELMTWCYGYLMQDRGVIPLKLRALTAISMTTCLAREDMLRDWIRGALGLGCTKKEITEAIITMSIYAGFPVTRKGLKVAQEVFADFED